MDQAVKADWLSKNWKWFVPVFCLLVTLVIGALVAVVMSFALRSLKSGELYQQAVATARLNTELSEALGRPLKEGVFASGTFKYTNTSGRAEITIPVSGPRGSGTITLKARRTTEPWLITSLVAEIAETKRNIDLLERAPAVPTKLP
jgi:hypothetical protein